MNENWTENYKKAAQGNDYVKLNAGLMKVKDLDNYLSSFPSSLLSFNKTGEFTYYKQLPGMNYTPPELGENIAALGQTESEKKQLTEISESGEFIIVAMESDIDHIHLMIQYLPRVSISSIIQKIKQITTFYVWRDERFGVFSI